MNEKRKNGWNDTNTMNTEPTSKRERPFPRRFVKFTGVWIPAIIWEHADLNCTEKCLLAEIHALCEEDGACAATNEWLGNQVGGLSAVRVSTIISKLKDLGLIEQTSFDGRNRILKTLFR